MAEKPRSRVARRSGESGKSACPVTTYVRAVVSGRIVAGRLVKLACERHLVDLKSGGKRGLVWDGAAARHAIDFFGHLRHSTGEWAGEPFVLQDWQQFVVGSLYGWKRKNGPGQDSLRRFRTAYVEVARKNGKSALLTFFDAEEKVAARITAEMVKLGVVARAMPQGDIIGFAPPLCLSREEAGIIVEKTSEAVKAVLG